VSTAGSLLWSVRARRGAASCDANAVLQLNTRASLQEQLLHMLHALDTMSMLGIALMRIRAPVYGEGVKAELHESAAKVHSPVRAAEQQLPCPSSTEALKQLHECLLVCKICALQCACWPPRHTCGLVCAQQQPASGCDAKHILTICHPCKEQ
jgi:hypothetical protein